MPSSTLVAQAFRAVAKVYDAEPLQALVYRPVQKQVRRRLERHAAGRMLPVVVDVGVGTGESLHWLPDLARTVVGVDFSSDMLGNARHKQTSRTHLVRASGTELPFASQSANAVISCFSMHWWPDLSLGFREIHRVLHPQGIALVVVPALHPRIHLPLQNLMEKFVSATIAHVLDAQQYARLAQQAGLNVSPPEHLFPLGWLLELRR